MVEQNQQTPSAQPVVESRRRHDWTFFLVAVGLLLVLNFVASRYFFRIDLTQDKRYTISNQTKQLLGNLQEPVQVTVYLEGEFPAGFRRLQNSIRETLEEFRLYSDGKVQYTFIDPNANTNEQARNQFYQQLVQKGLQPTNLFATEGDKKVEKIVFPGALISAGNKETAAILLKGSQAATPDERLNQSIEGLEYELATALRKVASTSSGRIGVLQGHGELWLPQAADFLGTISEYYTVNRVQISQVPNLNNFNLVVMMKPTQPYSEADKYKLDQFIMRGGKVLFLLDGVRASLDSVRENGLLAFPYDLNLQDLLFKYGVRVNPDLVQDLNASFIPMVTGYMGNQPQTQLVPWRYYPLINSFSQLPVTRNLDVVQTKFVSSIDTVKAVGIKKSPLLWTSQYSRIRESPVSISLNDPRIDRDPKLFGQSAIPVGYLLEGRFKSVFTNRPVPEGVTIPFEAEGKATQLVVFSDGDLAANDVDPRSGRPLELGFDRFSRSRFANKELLKNVVDYLLDEKGLIELRGKEIEIRPLDKAKLRDERTKWQAINLGVPLVLLLLFGVMKFWWRKRKYAR
ncbi:gliding motility-associated ABC transporter substrate-binding protein GldG [Rufibacter quisquiliarum]|uniref:Gliding-associated putative ABC transporter substrate-binding component GldG n=1 Tax=Rufibacter quisquiliarum TaxID=1549639 RepID=A0A839GVN3_9BACT|nr:gliding motility-associated ABC transporter substrate-binding protein GldG [Rufibacter quisquiliarum]MBA9077821.1 gliding-associated putative ABC transporter substrate-binding component GldG [Rufibacter quisquiliarum]